MIALPGHLIFVTMIRACTVLPPEPVAIHFPYGGNVDFDATCYENENQPNIIAPLFSWLQQGLGLVNHRQQLVYYVGMIYLGKRPLENPIPRRYDLEYFNRADTKDQNPQPWCEPMLALTLTQPPHFLMIWS
ncbi:hypothetical protein VNO77_07902 [Canavalia gladiata]|uniref:Uncharacterized protein n=1 Tax=Canavalia gladiata TaxID=3824 RepID=A0AAN9M8U5_CANGL